MKSIVVGILSGCLFVCWVTGILYEFGTTYEVPKTHPERIEMNVDN